MPVWDQYKDDQFTFFSGLSTGLQLLFLICCSWSNFMVTSSMESCSRSQNPARSWEVGRGMALGSCGGRGWEELQIVVKFNVNVCGTPDNKHCYRLVRIHWMSFETPNMNTGFIFGWKEG